MKRIVVTYNIYLDGKLQGADILDFSANEFKNGFLSNEIINHINDEVNSVFRKSGCYAGDVRITEIEV